MRHTFHPVHYKTINDILIHSSTQTESLGFFQQSSCRSILSVKSSESPDRINKIADITQSFLSLNHKSGQSTQDLSDIRVYRHLSSLYLVPINLIYRNLTYILTTIIKMQKPLKLLDSLKSNLRIFHIGQKQNRTIST